MSWFTQKDDYSCGVIALMNIGKWAGLKIKGEEINFKKHFKTYCKLTNCAKNKAADTIKVLFLILKIPCVSVMHLRYLSIELIDEMLKTGIVLLSVAVLDVPRESHHWCIITEKKKEKYFVLNHTNGKNYWLSSKTVKEDLLFEIYGDPKAYHIVQKLDRKKCELMI